VIGEFLESAVGQLLSAAVWTAIAASFAFWGVRRLQRGFRTREFEKFFGMYIVREAERPIAFKVEQIAIGIWTGLACILVVIGLIVLGQIFVRIIA
jgi:hypothetical protein